MDGFSAFSFGIWFGLTGPLALHISIKLLSQHSQHANASREEILFVRVVRFVGSPLLMLGILGVASILGFSLKHDNLGAIGMFTGLVAYGMLFLLYRRIPRVDAQKVPTDRESWLNNWQMVRAAGWKTFLFQHLLIGCVLGLCASLILYAVAPLVKDTNIGELPWVLFVFAFFPLVIVLYARWTWSVSERQFHALRSDKRT